MLAPGLNVQQRRDQRIDFLTRVIERLFLPSSPEKIGKVGNSSMTGWNLGNTDSSDSSSACVQ
jgi:hypothetical protein